MDTLDAAVAAVDFAFCASFFANSSEYQGVSDLNRKRWFLEYAVV